LTAKFIRISSLASTPVSPATIWRWVSAGKFPKPIKLGPCVTAWHTADIERFLAAQVGCVHQ
jgi:predicted DNA-binding transcriptional regulator AlpA